MRSEKAPQGAAGEVGRPRSGKGAAPLLSLCMIVKNEAARLPTALASAAPYVDEIVVVDTGSSDETPEIAKSYGAQVFHHPWEHSFSKARNQSISHATGEWILIMDADEELDPETAPRIRPFIQKVGPEVVAIFLELHNQLPAGLASMVMHPRIFRNVPDFHYEGDVHNDPRYRGRPARTAIRLHHYGYNLDPATMAQKHERRLTMIRKWLEREPGNLAPHAYLAQALMFDSTSYAEAAEEARRALAIAKGQNYSKFDLPRCYYPLIASLCALGRDEEAKGHAEECLAALPFYPDPHHFLAHIAMKEGRFDDLLVHSRRFVASQDEAKRNPENFRFVENMTVNQLGQNLYRWFLAAMVLDREAEAEEVFRRIVVGEGDEKHAKLALENTVLNRRDRILPGLIGVVAETRPEWSWNQRFARALDETRQRERAKQAKQEAAQAAQGGDWPRAAELWRQAVAAVPQDVPAYLALGEALVEAGRGGEAEEPLVQGLSGMPTASTSWRRLGDIYFGRGDYRAAREIYDHYLTRWPGDAMAGGRLNLCRRRTAQTPEGATVAENPPGFLLFLVNGLSPAWLRQAVPSFLMGRAWGEWLVPEGLDLAASEETWARLLATPPAPEGEGLWAAVARRHSLGLLAAPQGSPPPGGEGWAAAGSPAWLLKPSLVTPGGLTPRLLTRGYRPGFAPDEQPEGLKRWLAGGRGPESLLYDWERAKLRAALALPAVEVLAVGIGFLDLLHQVEPGGSERLFGAYQQLYGWLDTWLAALRPRGFAILSQRGYPLEGPTPLGGGCYALSWLRGENRQGDPGQLAPQIRRFLEADGEAGGFPAS